MKKKKWPQIPQIPVEEAELVTLTDFFQEAELLPCPFCGSEDLDVEFWRSEDGSYGPGCMACGASAESVEAWNRRTP